MRTLKLAHNPLSSLVLSIATLLLVVSPAMRLFVPALDMDSPVSALAIAEGNRHTCALTSSGGVKCWGRNQYGQLGNNTTTTRLTPVDVSGLTSGVTAIAAGEFYSCGLINSGGVRCWGLNQYGQLGDNTTTTRLTPVDVSGLTSGVTAIATSWQHACALLGNGEVKCWGRNQFGQLGNGTTTDAWTPVNVTGLTGEVTAIAAGGYHTCAVLSDGGVECWGYNNYGQLGNGNTTDALMPVDVNDLTSEVTEIAAGITHTCALTGNGGVKCWGYNIYGQLGDGTTTHRLPPVDVTGLTSGVTAIVAGEFYTCALTSSGGVKCWGLNHYGQLGDSTTTKRLAPVDVSGLTSGVTAIAAGFHHTCAPLSAGGIKCWGRNTFGQLGDGTTTDTHIPIDVAGTQPMLTPTPTADVTPAATATPTPVNVLSITAGSEHTCALIAGGGVWCWGLNQYGQIGDGTTTTRLVPVAVSGLASGVTSITAGTYYTCALTSSGAVKCWGDNTFGQLGNGTTTAAHTPMDVSGLTSGVTAIAAIREHTCALLNGGGVKCWGANGEGQLGNGTTTDAWTPVDVSDLTSSVTVIATGGYHTCALLNGGVKCWGYNHFGQLGNGTTTSVYTPRDVSSLTSAISISAGGYHTCARLSGGGVKCWGLNQYGQLGDGTTPERYTPVDVNGLAAGVSMIVSEWDRTCALTSDGGVECSGHNEYGQLGDGTTTDAWTLVDVNGLASGVIAISGGNARGTHTCALLSGGGVKCWGRNTSGQLGDGTTTERHTPVDVVGFPPLPMPTTTPTSMPTATSTASETPTLTPTSTPTNTPTSTPTASSAPTITPIPFNFTGFFQPVDNPPVLNVVKAGRTVAVKFSLSGDQGLNIFDIGYPKSQVIACDTGAPLDDVEETITGPSGLSYDPLTDQYNYHWKTTTTWVGTCRQLIMRLNDGTNHVANFKFK